MRSLVPDVTEGPREDILSCVREHPGIHLRGVERRTELPLGQVLYHLDRLERMGLVASHRDSGFRRYFSADAISRVEKPILSALRHDVPRRLVLALLERPGLPHKTLQALAGVAGSTLSFHLQRLVASGVLRREREGASRLYTLADPDLALRELASYRASFDDPAVDAFLARRAIGGPKQATPAGQDAPVPLAS